MSEQTKQIEDQAVDEQEKEKTGGKIKTTFVILVKLRL